MRQRNRFDKNRNMKTALILVLSSDWFPYNRLTEVSMETWDSIEVPGLETVYYCSESEKKDTDKIIYLPIDNGLFSIGKKTLLAFEWALKNKEFDYISRPQANVYINKKELIKHIQTLPDTNVYATLEVVSNDDSESYGWGCGTLLSKDVVQKIVDSQVQWDHKKMEDVSMSQLVKRLGIQYTKGIVAAIDNMKTHWRVISYNIGESFDFNDFSEIPAKTEGHYWYRCKMDHDRTQDEIVMRELFKYLK